MLLLGGPRLMREGLRLLINAQTDLTVVGESDGLTLTPPLLRRGRPDIAVLDLAEEGHTALGLLSRLTHEVPSLRVLALVGLDADPECCVLLRAGARGCVPRAAGAVELTNAIRVVTEGGLYVAPTAAVGWLTSAVTSAESAIRSAGPLFSRREEMVLRLLALGFTHKEIAGKLGLSVKTIETYKARVGKKAGLRSRAEIVRYALRLGWLRPR